MEMMNKVDKMETEQQEFLQHLRGLRPIDEEFICCFFDDNIPLIQFVLRILTGKPDLIIEDCWTGWDKKHPGVPAFIRVSAYGKDSAGKQCVFEMLRADKDTDQYRARFYSSVMDIWNLSEGRDFDEMPDTYTIFLLEKDVFEMNKPVYPVERMNVLTGKPFEDGKHILYVNTAYRDDSDIGRLMHDFNCAKVKEMYLDLFAGRIRFLKKDPNGIYEAYNAIQKMGDNSPKG